MTAESPFERAGSAVVEGDDAHLRGLLTLHPELVHERASAPHRATVLHYVGANGIEPQRSRFGLAFGFNAFVDSPMA